MAVLQAIHSHCGTGNVQPLDYRTGNAVPLPQAQYQLLHNKELQGVTGTSTQRRGLMYARESDGAYQAVYPHVQGHYGQGKAAILQAVAVPAL